MMCIIVWMLLNTVEGVRKSIKYIVIFVSALLTRVAMGFSPTLYASGNRTFIFLEFAIIFLTVCIYFENEEKIRKNKNIYGILSYLFMGIVGITILGNLMSINC